MYFFALVATSFGRYSHHLTNTYQCDSFIFSMHLQHYTTEPRYIMLRIYVAQKKKFEDH
jgi:hypothetical protein